MADKQQQFQPYHFFVGEFVADTLHINQLHGRDAGNEVCLNRSKQFSAIGHLLLEWQLTHAPANATLTNASRVFVIIK